MKVEQTLNPAPVMAILEATVRDARQQRANQPEPHRSRFGAASNVLIGNTLSIIVLMERQAGHRYRNNWKNEPGLRAPGARGSLRIEG
jgi:hypothetical protein